MDIMAVGPAIICSIVHNMDEVSGSQLFRLSGVGIINLGHTIDNASQVREKLDQLRDHR